MKIPLRNIRTKKVKSNLLKPEASSTALESFSTTPVRHKLEVNKWQARNQHKAEITCFQ